MKKARNDLSVLTKVAIAKDLQAGATHASLVELTSKLIPRFRRGFLVLFITTINERISGHAPIPRLSLFPRFQMFICMEKCFRAFQAPRFQRFSDSRGSPIPEVSL